MSVPRVPTNPDHGYRRPDTLGEETYRRLRAMAARQMASGAKGQTLHPTVLVHEAWLKIAGGAQEWRDEAHFFASASVIMRHILIDHLRRKARQRRHGAGHHDPTAIDRVAAPARPEAILLLDEGVTELERVDPERARVVVARFFGGLSNVEIARAYDISERSVERHWATAKVWLHRWVSKCARHDARPRTVA